MKRHAFEWTHAAPSECFECCEYLAHWEARCVWCGALETVEAKASPCEARTALTELEVDIGWAL